MTLPSTGFHYGVPFVQYQAWDAVNISTLKPMHRSAAHCRYAMDNPREASDEMDVGSATHVSMLEPARFEKEFYLGKEEYNATTKEGKIVRDREMEEAAGRTHIRRKAGKDAVDADDVEGMTRAVWEARASKYFLQLPGQCEVSALWQDPVTGLLCKGRFDKLITATRPTILELKTARDAADWAFGKQIADKDYDAQAAYYLWAHKTITGTDALHVFVAIENKGPWASKVHTLGDATLQSGAVKFRKWLDRYAECVKSGKWPGYEDRVSVVDVPKYSLEVA